MKLRMDIVVGGVAFAACAGLVYFFIIQGYAVVSSQRAELAALRVQVESGTELVVALQEAEAAIRAASAREDLGTRVPEHMDFGGFFQTLQQSASARGVEVRRLQPGTPDTQETLHVLPVTFLAGGAFQDLYLLLNDLRQMPRLLKIEQLNLMATEDPGVCELELAMLIYATVGEGGAA